VVFSLTLLKCAQPMNAPTFTVFCRSCAYRREWPTVPEAIADVLRHRAENADNQATALQATALPPPSPDSSGGPLGWTKVH
jgi:hypothetical protein